jgi:AcrR family transcriptional regulator
MSGVDATITEEVAGLKTARGESGRSLSGEKAQRIVEAMRASVARRGSAGSTFDHVSREAGVSRGLLHYYFGTKEQLLLEAVRRDSELRMERLQEQLAAAQTADDFIGLLEETLHRTVNEEPDVVTLMFELFGLARRNAEIAVEYAELMRRMREHLAGVLDAGEKAGVLRLHADAEAVSEILFALGDGMLLRMLSEPGRDYSAAIDAGITCVRALLTP